MTHASIAGGLVAVLLVAAPMLRAQGAGVYPHDACMLGRASAGVADPCDTGSAVYYGPAALALLPGATAAGLTTAVGGSEFSFDDPARGRFESEQGPLWIPHLWATARPAPRLGIGIGLWAPYGLRTEWPLAFEGRYVGFKNSLTTIFIQPTLAYQLVAERLALAAGLDAVRGMVEINQRIDLATTAIPGTTTSFAAIGVPPGTDFANLRLRAAAWTASFHAGLQAVVSDRVAVGVRYLHTAGLEPDDGTADFDQVATGIPLPPDNPLGLPAGTPLDAVLAPLFGAGGPLRDQRFRTSLTLPNQLVAGIRVLAADRLRLLLDYQWTGWNRFDQAVLDFAAAPADTIFLDFDNTSTVRLGADYAATDDWRVRGGIFHNTAATPEVTVTPLLPEGRRWNLTIGVGYRLGERLRADAGFEYIFQEDRRGRVRPRTSRSQPPRELNVGVYQARAFVIGGTLSYRMGRSPR